MFSTQRKTVRIFRIFRISDWYLDFAHTAPFFWCKVLATTKPLDWRYSQVRNKLIPLPSWVSRQSSFSYNPSHKPGGCIFLSKAIRQPPCWSNLCFTQGSLTWPTHKYAAYTKGQCSGSTNCLHVCIVLWFLSKKYSAMITSLWLYREHPLAMSVLDISLQSLALTDHNQYWPFINWQLPTSYWPLHSPFINQYWLVILVGTAG